MSRVENVLPASSDDRHISHQLQRIPCGRCYAVIEYGRGTEWRVVSGLVNEHWKACPGKPHVLSARMASTPVSPPDRPIVLPSLVVSTWKPQDSSDAATESVGSQNNAWISSGCERKRRTLEQRKTELEQDEYTRSITTKSVVCGGCHKEISLDKRSKYYPGLWIKHRGKCPGIEKLEHAKALKVAQVPNDRRNVNCSVVIPVLNGNGYEDVLELSLAERSESRSSGATRRSVRQYDSGDPSSEDEDEDEDDDFLLQVPFPTQNGEFYRSQRCSGSSYEWTYRYATQDEIATNLFRGQDEPSVGLGGRPITHLSPQSSDRCETPRCVLKKRAEQAVSHPAGFTSTKELSEPGKDVAPCPASVY